VVCDNDPMTVAEGGVWRWRSVNEVYDAESAERVSEPVEAYWDEAFCKRALLFCHRDGAELWLSDPDDADGLVWVYAYRQDAWYLFENVGAQAYFRWNGQVGFLRDGILYAFDEGCVRDDEGRTDREIVGVWREGFLDFGDADRVKRLAACILRGDFEDGAVRLEVESERGRGGALFFHPEAAATAEAPRVACGRINPGRFRLLRTTLTAYGDGRTRLSGMTLTIR
jgi:hypothetical protein